MNPLDIDNLEIVRTMLLRQGIECQIHDNTDACPLHKMRKLPFPDKNKWAKSLTSEELLNLYLAHCKCMVTNEA